MPIAIHWHVLFKIWLVLCNQTFFLLLSLSQHRNGGSSTCNPTKKLDLCPFTKIPLNDTPFDKFVQACRYIWWHFRGTLVWSSLSLSSLNKVGLNMAEPKDKITIEYSQTLYSYFFVLCLCLTTASFTHTCKEEQVNINLGPFRWWAITLSSLVERKNGFFLALSPNY